MFPRFNFEKTQFSEGSARLSIFENLNSKIDRW